MSGPILDPPVREKSFCVLKLKFFKEKFNMNELPARILDKLVISIAGRMIKSHSPGPGPTGPVLSRAPFPRQIDQCYPPPREVPRLHWTSNSDFRFKTPLPSPYPENNTVYGRYFRAKGGKTAPVVILLHGWMMKCDILYRSICFSLSRNGLDAILFELPFHKRRAPRGTFSGEYFISPNMPSTFQALRQAIAETRSLIKWLKENMPSRPVGIMGLSLGGWIGGMLTILEPRLSFSILAAPAAEPARMKTESSLGRKIYPEEEPKSSNQTELEEITRVVTPRCFTPAIAENRILLIENLYDCFIPPAVIARLKQSWGNPRFKKYPHGHISIFFSRKFKRDIAEFIKEICGSNPEV